VSNHLQLPVVITPSRAELGARCHRRHFLSDVLSRARYSAASLEFGSVIHAGQAAHWLGRDAVMTVREEWHNRFELTDVSQDKVSEEMAVSMMEYYIKNAKLAGPFQDAADDWKLVDVEQRFELPLRDTILSFQCDRTVYSSKENWLLVGDLKTASRLDARWERQWETSLQMKLYTAGAKNVFQTHGRVSVFIEGLYKHVPSELRYYACPEWSDSLLAEAAFNAYQVASLDRDIIMAGSDRLANIMDPDSVKLIPNQEKIENLAVRQTPVNYGDCFSYNVECPFRRLCVAEPDERAPILRSEYFEKPTEDY